MKDFDEDLMVGHNHNDYDFERQNCCVEVRAGLLRFLLPIDLLMNLLKPYQRDRTPLI